MTIKKIRAITHLLACMVVCNSVQAQDNKKVKIEVSTDLDYIDPTIGNVGQLLQPTRPTVQQPNQMMRMYPVRADHIDDQIASFPLLIVSHRLGMTFSMKPALALPKTADDWKKKMTFDHDLEITRPWYYSTYLIDNGINVEFAPGKKTGIYRFAFPANAHAKCLLLEHYNTGSSSWDLIADNEIAATETYHGDIKVYMYGSFNAKCKIEKLDETKASVSFGSSANDTIELKYAVSFVSADQAKKNYEDELRATTFEQLTDDAQLSWQKVIGQVKVEGGTTAQKRSFYTALYRCYERMVDITEDGKYYSGYDKKIHVTDRPFYVDDWTWDTYLAHHPLRAILNPSMEEDMLNSYVNMYEQSGWMPTFPVLFGDHACMNGFHSSVMFLDDMRKGLKNFDVEKAYEGMLKNTTQATMLPWRNGPKTELEDVYYAKGFFPALKPGEAETVPLVNSFEKRQAVAVTLGAAYDDWAVSEMAAMLGKEKDHSKFSARALNYKTLWNKQQKIFLPKDAQGNWINIDPKFDGGKGGRDYYDENNGWTYMWQVQHDISGLMALMGGRNDFENRLDQLFREPLGRSKSEMWYKFPDATGLVGQYSMGNEPSFHIPYLYNFTSSPWKTQKRIRFLLSTWFKDNIFGIPGDEDGGGMSAFVVFSSLGFYPVTPGIPTYTIGSPLFTKSTIDLQNGKQFTVVANNSSVVNKYIQRAKLNGQVINTPWFTHQQLMDGGTLELEMGPKPNKRWGTGEKAGF